MSWQLTEFLLKGVYLGLLLFVALRRPSWEDLGYVGLCTLGGVVLFVGVAAVRKLREGYRVRGRRLAFLLFLLLENPGLVYAGVLTGMLAGAYVVRFLAGESTGREGYELAATVGGGAALGLVFYLLRLVRHPRQRLLSSLALGAALAGAGILVYQYRSDVLDDTQWAKLGALLLLGMPLFYLLTFASLVEESEVEIGAICAALGLGLWIVGADVSTFAQTLGLVLAGLLYYMYTRYVLKGLRVFKHVLRGVSYASVGRYRWALISLGRARQLDPNNALARQALWSVHRDMDFQEIAGDPDTLAVVDFELCLERAGALLLQPPKPAQLDEAARLLNFVASQRPALLPRCDYWRAVADLHRKQYEAAAADLTAVLSGSDAAEPNPHRRVILLPAWQLALGHPEMKRRVAQPLLQQPGRRLEAIAAVERQLAAQPNDAPAWELKRVLYHDLTEADYQAGTPAGQPAADFDHPYCQEMGLALVNDAGRWQRGAEYLRVAARGLTETAPALYVQVARACEKAGDVDGAWKHYELARDAGRTVGPANLSEQDRDIYFQVVRMLADTARENNQTEKAIENYRLYAEGGKGGKETYRVLAELYEQKGDVWSAVHATEHGLTYDGSDQDLLEKKDRYYYSVGPDDLRARLEQVHKWFDAAYCVRKARWLLDKQGSDPDVLDWAGHLLGLAQVLQPESLTVRVLRGRVCRQQGHIPEAVELLEQVRGNKPESFPSADEEEAWYTACRILGDIYLSDQPAKALECFLTYRKSPRSGADTWYKLGVAYEHLGDVEKATHCYRQVVAYERHPLAPDARSALARLRQPS